MFIETERTPNPATLKFLPGRDIMGDSTAHFPNLEAAAKSPLAQRLFGIDGVAAVFLGGDFITITTDGTDWQDLKPAVLGAAPDAHGERARERREARGERRIHRLF